MADLETDFFIAEKLSRNIVKIVVHQGIEVKKESAQASVEKLVKLMGGDFGMVIHRKNDYSIDPHSIYTYLNTVPQMKAIAIVVHRESYLGMIKGQQIIYHNPLEGFLTLESAIEWMERLMNELPSEE